MRLARVLHDLALALLCGGIAGVFLCVTVLFARAPSRATAGDIGSAIFGRLGPIALLLALIVMGARILPGFAASPGAWRRLAAAASAVMVAVAAFNALWLTPRMIAIWSAGARAADGSGLMGDERRQFLMLHGVSNLAYLVLLALGLLVMLLPAGGHGRRD